MVIFFVLDFYVEYRAVFPHDSASVHACAYLVQAKTLEPSVLFLESAVIFSNVFEPQKHLKIPS